MVFYLDCCRMSVYHDIQVQYCDAKNRTASNFSCVRRLKVKLEINHWFIYLSLKGVCLKRSFTCSQKKRENLEKKEATTYQFSNICLSPARNVGTKRFQRRKMKFKQSMNGRTREENEMEIFESRVRWSPRSIPINAVYDPFLWKAEVRPGKFGQKQKEKVGK